MLGLADRAMVLELMEALMAGDIADGARPARARA